MNITLWIYYLIGHNARSEKYFDNKRYSQSTTSRVDANSYLNIIFKYACQWPQDSQDINIAARIISLYNHHLSNDFDVNTHEQSYSTTMLQVLWLNYTTAAHMASKENIVKMSNICIIPPIDPLGNVPMNKYENSHTQFYTY